MLPEKVDEYLSTYRRSCARYDSLRRKLMKNEADVQRALEYAAVKGQQYTGMPHGNGATRPVEQLVLDYIDGRLHPQIRLWQEEGDAIRREIRQIESQRAMVDIWLGALRPNERLVVEKKHIDGMSWPEMESVSTRLFGYHMSKSGLKKLCARAMQKIYDIAA